MVCVCVLVYGMVAVTFCGIHAAHRADDGVLNQQKRESIGIKDTFQEWTAVLLTPLFNNDPEKKGQFGASVSVHCRFVKS